MGDCPESRKLFQSVANRLRLGSIGQSAFVGSCVAGILYAIAFVASRLLGLTADWFHPVTVLLIPTVGLLAAVMFHRRPTHIDTARQIDTHEKTKDLFLTVTMLDSTAGEYQSLVTSDAEARAPKAQPERIVRWNWQDRAAWTAGTVVVLLAAVLFAPQLDPFGRVEAANMVEQARDDLENTKKSTEVRKAELKKNEDDGELSDDVKKAVEGVVNEFRKMKQQMPKKNSEALAARQKEMGAKWRAVRNSDDLKELMNRSESAQSFGKNTRQLQKWSEGLQEGRPETLQKAMDEMKETLEQLRKETDPVKKQELEQKLKRGLKDLEDFAREKVKSPQLRAALKRAMQQLQAAKMDPQLAAEALEGAMESMELARMELQQIAQSARDLKELEKALEAIQRAKKLNQDGEQEELDDLGDEATLEDYAEFYAELMAALGQGDGEGGDGNGDGTGGRGQGRGGDPGEDDSVDTGFKKETSKSAITAGKVLLSMKVKGVSEAGDTKQQYQQLVRDVRQGLSEAIELEEIPPGYVPSIKKYFNTLDESESDSQPVGSDAE
jgi:tetratricopeptide (TPR) repeat protein